MKSIVAGLVGISLFSFVYADTSVTIQYRDRDNVRKESHVEPRPKNYIMVPGHIMREEEPHRRHETTTIINTMPNGSFIQYGTRVAPIVVERNYYNPGYIERPRLSYAQQQSNYRLLVDVLKSPVTQVTDLGFGYLVPGPEGKVFYHSKSGNMAPMTLEDFYLSEEYYYLTGQRP